MPPVFMQPFVIGMLQYLLGLFLKRNPHFSNRFIPVATYVLALFGYAVVPQVANAAGALTGIVGVTNVFLVALLQNLLVTGTHSTLKNTFLPTVKSVLERFMSK